MSETDEQGAQPVALDELGQAFERWYHAISRRNKADGALADLQAEAEAAKQEHQDAYQAVMDLQQGKTPVVPE